MMGNEQKKGGTLRFALLVVSTLLAALSFVFLTCFITDRFNTAMAFINNGYTKLMLIWSFAIFAVLVLLSVIKKAVKPPVAVLMGLYGIAQAALVVLVAADRFNRSAILFTREPVKMLFAAASVLGVAVSVVVQAGFAKKQSNTDV